MRKVTLGRTGLEVSAVGFGGIPIMRVSDDEAVAAIHRALDLGVTFIDTAAGYADSQRKIGLAIADRRDGLVIATKSGERTKQGVLADVERARSEMGLDTIDIFQLHGVGAGEDWDERRGPGGALEGLIEAREKGWIAHIGYTSHSLEVAMDLAEMDVFETVQFPFNLVTREPGDELIPKARQRGLGFIVMKPLCGGQYDDAELAFRFLNDFPDLVPIPGIERPAEIEQIVEIVESGRTLTGEDKVRAEQIVARLGKLFCRRCGYCMPCPNGVPVTTIMVYDGLMKRISAERCASVARTVAETSAECTECGRCETKCPYDLPIMETVKTAGANARKRL